MWTCNKTEIVSNKVYHYKINDTKDKPLSTLQWISLLLNSSTFRSYYTNLLIESKFEGFFWEVRPVQIDNLKEDFEFVIIDSPALANLKSDSSYFQSYFKKGESVTTFYNLGKDAKLVTPCPIDTHSIYAHFSIFLNNAENEQIHDIWKSVANEYIAAINEKPTWLSTSGLGVSWLHIRLDQIPKYYQYKPFSK